MPTIHPTAIVERGARIADDAIIGPLCHVGPKATIGPGSRLISHVTILGRTTLGEHNVIWPYATLGGDPQDLKFKGEDSELILGDRNEIRENVTLHKGTHNGGNVTRIGNDNLLMVGCHVAHDCIIGNHCIIANAVQLAGHVFIEDHAAIAGASGVHHFVTIGQYAYIGGLTRVVHDVPPFLVVEGNPARVRKVNTTLLDRCRFPPEQVTRLKQAFRLLYGDGESRFVGRTSEVLRELDERHPDDRCIKSLTDAIRKSGLGVHGRFRESLRNDNPHANPVK
jgi:UDP-N-acetylglucosamine acyltransferase